MPDSTKPCFGQVWLWKSTGAKFMLIAPRGEPGTWLVVFIAFAYGVGFFLQDAPMHGLHDDPARRIEGYELLEDVE